MQIARDIAGFPGPKADTLRAAIGKKKRDLMASLKQEFIEGCNTSGTSSSVGNQLWALMEAAADYSFNRSPRGLLRADRVPNGIPEGQLSAEYMAALISSVMSTKDKVPFFVSRCEEMGIDVLPPDVNQSGHDFVVVEGDIRFGLDAVKNVGYAAVEKILEARARGRRLHLDLGLLRARRLPHREQEGNREPDQVRRTRLDRRDAQGDARRAAAGPGARREDAGGRAVRARARSSTSAPPERGAGRRRRTTRRCPRTSSSASSSCTREGDPWHLPLQPSAGGGSRICCAARTDCSLAELASKPDGAWVTVGGLITQAKRIRTKSGDPMMFATLDDLEGQVEMLIFNSAYASNESHVGVDKRVIVRGRVDHKDRGETKLVVQEVEPFEPTAGRDRGGRRRARRPAGSAGGPPGGGRHRLRRAVVIKVDARRCDETPDRRSEGVARAFSRADARCCWRWIPQRTAAPALRRRTTASACRIPARGVGRAARPRGAGRLITDRLRPRHSAGKSFDRGYTLPAWQ